MRLSRMAARLQDVQQIQCACGEQGKGFRIGMQGLPAVDFVGDVLGIGQNAAQQAADGRTQTKWAAKRGNIQA